MEDFKTIDIKSFLKLCLKYWWVILLGVLFSILYSFYKVRYMDKSYSSSVMILVDDKTTKTDMETAMGSSLFGMRKNLDNEILILKSYPMVLKAVQNLNLNVSYFAKGEVKDSELYNDSPFYIDLINLDNNIERKNFYLIPIDSSEFHLAKILEDDETEILFKGAFNDTIRFLKSDFIVKRSKFPFKTKNRYYFNIRSSKDIAESLCRRIRVNISSDKSTILNVSMTGSILQKQIDYLNELAEVYIKKDLIRKDNIANNTIDFIDKQLLDSEVDLKKAEDKMEGFRRGKKLYSTDLSGEKLVANFEELESRKADIELRRKYYDYLQKYVNSNNDLNDLIAPSTMGIQDVLLVNTISELNALYSKKSTLYDIEEISPAKIELNNRINSLRKTLIENIKGIISSSEIELKDINSRVAKLERKISKLPRTEREYLKIKREFDFNSSIYSYLLEKKAEIGIAKAANSPDNEILERARASTSREISVSKSSVYRSNLIYGIGSGLLVVFLIYYFKSKIAEEEDIKKITNIPVIAKINSFKNLDIDLNSIYTNPKSMVSEAFRNLRLNLQFLGDESKSKVIGFTSSISGEGKTFCAAYTSASLSFSGKKVILIGCDLRKPKIGEYFELDHDRGVSNYLSGRNTLEEVIQSSSHDNYDVILSGPIPPNPAELLENIRFTELIIELRKTYDYVVLDSSPIGLVSDYFLISKFVDITLLLVRQDHTERKFVADLDAVKNSGKLKDSYIVFNDFKFSSSYGYGYGYGGKSYGYGYGYLSNEAPKNNFFTRLFGSKK